MIDGVQVLRLVAHMDERGMTVVTIRAFHNGSWLGAII